MTLKFLGSFGTKPLYAFGTVGVSSLSVGAGLSGYTLSRKIFSPHLRIHRTGKGLTPPLLSISLSFSGLGLLCIMIGLLAELLTRTYYEAQDKPTYVVKHFLSGSRDTINDELLPKLQVTPLEKNIPEKVNSVTNLSSK
jgi:hypothetical protein